MYELDGITSLVVARWLKRFHSVQCRLLTYYFTDNVTSERLGAIRPDWAIRLRDEGQPVSEWPHAKLPPTLILYLHLDAAEN